MTCNRETIIIGGGLAGLICAIHLRKLGHQVMVIEKSAYPQHKVCGEYVSNEVLAYLKWLDCDPNELVPTRIHHLSFSSKKGKSIDCNLPLGGFGISRYTLDHFLYKKAVLNGCEFIIDKVMNVAFQDDGFLLTTIASGQITCKLAIGAYGKRSGLDQLMQRHFITKKSSWLAVKGHFKGDHPSHIVGLHNFEGGYCGVSVVENDRINICYLTDYLNFKKHKNIADFQENVLYKNPILKQAFEKSTLLFDQPLTISQISFEKKEAVYQHILMVGDTAGLIHPLCGNGMAMAIHSAKICAELVDKFLTSQLSRSKLEDQYSKEWSINFNSRLAMGRLLSRLIRIDYLYGPLMRMLIKFPSLLAFIIKKTHGKPILIA